MATDGTAAAGGSGDGDERPESAPQTTGSDPGEVTTAVEPSADAGTLRATGRWAGIAAVVLLAAGVGLLTGRAAALLVGALGFGFALYAGSTRPPTATLSIERTVSTATPDPGEAVAVTTELTNTGEGRLPDLRVIDGVPTPLSVESGAPRRLGTLAPGESLTVAYELTAERGVHRFEPVTAVALDASGANERRLELPAPEPTLTCTPRLDPGPVPPLRQQTTVDTGVQPSGTTGHGVEFHSVREYHPGDDLSRVDWRHLARTGEPATVTHHAERMATVVILVDAREDAYTAPTPDGTPAIERSVAAARGMARGLLADGNGVGVAAFGEEFGWLRPSVGRDHRARLERFLALDPSLSATAPDQPFLPRQLRELWARMPAHAQVTYVSPLLDRFAGSLPHRLESRGNLVTAVSPDMTATDTPGRSLAAIERANRVDTIRRAAIPVVDWGADEPLATAIETVTRRWSR